ncbi:MAG: DUF4493 domain-containing protein [Muribaculaceae bacterium]|nr:DUF4493 domain-containing protein [Muribaculaceae bacterium]
MRHLKFGIPIFGAVVIATGLFSCADESHWGSSSNEKGSISLTLSTDSGVKTAKPVFRSEDDEVTQDPNDLSTYIQVPKPEDFSIKLEKSDESFSKTWTSLQGFLDYTKENFFSTGAYTLTAFYGDKGKQDFNAPYFEASTTFNVLSDEVYEVNLVAELMNSMVKVNYTDGFKNYMSDYHSRLRTEGRADEIIYTKDQDAPAFVEPNNAALSVHFTTKGKEFTSAVKIGEFPPMAKTLHNITLDIAETQNGEARLDVTFDDTLEEEKISIDLTEELLTTPAPMITPIGFTDGVSLDMLEGSACMSDVKMLVKSGDNIKSAILTIESNNYRPSWGNQIDLCKADENQKKDIEAAGISAIGFGFRGPTSDMAELDLTNLGKALPIGKHTISLQVTDDFDIPSNVLSVTLDSQPIELDIAGTPSMTYCAKSADITIDYNGFNPISDLKFQTISDMGNWVDVKINSVEEVAASRAIEKKQYICNLILPDNVSSIKEKLPFKIYQNGKEKASCEVHVIIPEYRLQYDAFNDHAYIKVNLNGNYGEDVMTSIIEKIYLNINGERQTSDIFRDSDNGYIVIGKLTPKTTYSVTSSITKGESWHEDDGSFTTEEERDIPNGEFNEEGDNFSRTGLQVGGKYDVNMSLTGSHHYYTLTSSIDCTLPKDWATINDLTAWSESQNKNTWYVVPSSWVEEGKGVMRNVGYNHSGDDIPASGGYANTKYYGENSPSDSQLDKAAGELFLGSYSFNGTETREDGISFPSRPTKISFDYEYEAYGEDAGEAVINLLDSDGKSLGNKTFTLKGNGTESISFDYIPFGKPAAKLIVSFKSSNLPVPPVNIPSGSALNENQSLGNHTLKANSYHAVAIGSVLKIDNVKAYYGNAQVTAKTPKKSNKKNR